MGVLITCALLPQGLTRLFDDALVGLAIRLDADDLAGLPVTLCVMSVRQQELRPAPDRTLPPAAFTSVLCHVLRAFLTYFSKLPLHQLFPNNVLTV